MAPSAAKRIFGALGGAAVFVLITILMFVLMEGVTSWLLLINDVQFRSGPTTNEYHESLGWVGRQNVTLTDFYGSGKTVINNSKGFRSEVEFDDAKPEGFGRVVCSGDSFTFGAGVGNGETWCDLLTHHDPKLEAVNMGISGYGIGQAMLRYEQQVGDLEHDLHIFAFISADVGRTALPSHNGYGRPVVLVEDGELVVENVPVPQLSQTLSRNADKLRAHLRSAEFAKRLLQRLAPPARMTREERTVAMIEEMSPIATRIFLRVDAAARERGARAVIVYLPVEADYSGPDAWERWLVDAMSGLDVPFVNLAPDLRELPADVIKSYFIPVGDPGETHYTRDGNKRAAHALNRRLREQGLLPKL
jgi:hypothetical protein